MDMRKSLLATDITGCCPVDNLSETMPVRQTFKMFDLATKWDHAIALICLWQQRSRARHDLAALPPYLRKDIGVSRAEAAIEIRKPFWKP